LKTLTVQLGAKTCSICGRSFGCANGRPGCWCESVSVTRETLGKIRAIASECICPACLSDFAGRAASHGPQMWAKAVPDADVRSRALAPFWSALAVAFLILSLIHI